jgi:glutamate-ammonia-ligase adenylyltransferase
MELGEAYVGFVSPLIWSAVQREHFVDDVRAMRRRVVDHAKSSLRSAPGAATVEREIKLGPGGLRDIEFAIQLLQLVHGRADPSLRKRATLDALEALGAGGFVGRHDAQQLADAYEFLRTVEHRIQLFRLERTHLMPSDEPSLRRIGRSMGFGTDPAGQLRTAWQAHARVVRQLHEKLFYRPLLSTVARLGATDVRLSTDAERLSAEAAKSRLTALGYADPAGALANIDALTSGLSRRAAIQRTLLPAFLNWFGDAPDPDTSLLAFRRLSDALGDTPWYLRSLRDEGETASRLAQLLSSGGYVPDLLMRAPDAVAQLSKSITPLTREALATEMTALVCRAPDAAHAVAAVRAVRRRELLRVAAADVLGQLGESADGPRVDAIGRALTEVTAATVQGALDAVQAFRINGGRQLVRFAVIGMGRFGGFELGYGSDADVLFVYEPLPGVDDHEASTRAFALATELRTLLQTPSTDPPLQIDADLRPEGRQGPLVRTLASYAAYYERWSNTWEAQALVRAAPVAGDADLGKRFVAAIDAWRYPEYGPSDNEVREIRRLKARMEAERLPRGADRALHTKLGPGGLSDVEWIAQLLQLKHAAEVPELRVTGTRDALAAAADAGLLEPEDAALLDEAWTHTSLLRNGITIVRGRTGDQVPTDAKELAGIARYLGEDIDSETLLDTHRRRARRARAAFERLFYDAD